MRQKISKKLKCPKSRQTDIYIKKQRQTHRERQKKQEKKQEDTKISNPR